MGRISAAQAASKPNPRHFLMEKMCTFQSVSDFQVLMIQHVYLHILPSYLVDGTHCSLSGGKFCTLGVLLVLNYIAHVVHWLGLGGSGWSQMPSFVPGKAVSAFQAGPKNVASDCGRKMSVWSPQVAFVRHSIASQWCRISH